MSPTDAKRGAKRRKNKRGGGGASCGSASCGAGGKAGAHATARADRAETPAAPAASFLTAGGPGDGGAGGLTGANGEVPMNGAPQFSEGPVNADFSGVLQTPFTFGLNQRAPYTTGDRCLLCRGERKDSALQESPSNGTDQSPNAPSALQLPLYVCPDCKHTVEKDSRQPPPDLSPLSQDFLLHVPVGNAGLCQDAVGTSGRLIMGAPPLPAPDLSTQLATDTVCSCEACSERREITAESERESQLLQNHWSEVRYLVRCIYRQTGTPLADDQDQPLERDRDGMKELVDRLCEKDPYQLYQRLEQQAREYILETKVRLLKQLSGGSEMAGAVQDPPQAQRFISLLLEEYSALCQAARTISTFLLTLESEHLKKFQVTWELHNKHLFESLVFSEPVLQSSLPALSALLRQGTASHDSYSEGMYRALLDSLQGLEQQMKAVSAEWAECEKRIDDYVDEQLLFKMEGQNLTNQRTEPHKSLISKNMSLRTKPRILKDDGEIFKQRKVFEDQFMQTSKKPLVGDSTFTDTVKQMLSSRLNTPDCPNCNYRRRCTCDDCSLSHILTCGIMDAPVGEELHLKLPMQAEPPQDYLSEVHPPSMSSGSSGSASGSGSASSSPITVQQHRHLLQPQDGAPTFGSDYEDDDDVPPLSAVYPLSRLEEAGVLASMNGLHPQLNGGADAIQDLSPRGSSSSSSEGDEEEAVSEGGPQPSLQQGALSRGKSDSPPPCYPHAQVEQVQHPCECHVCNQGSGGGASVGAAAPPPGRLHTGPPQLYSEKGVVHPGLHLYPHIHGHLPLHNLTRLPRPLLPALYSSTPLTHSKTLLPTSGHASVKQQVLRPAQPEHVYQGCFAGGGAWGGSLPCPSLKFENLWDTHMMKNWNPSVLLQEPVPGDMLGPPLPDVSLLSSGLDPSCSTSSSSPLPAPEGKEKQNGSKKKCLFNYQDAFMEASEVMLATSSAVSCVSCTATTVQSSEVFHNMVPEEHVPPGPVAPRTSPTGSACLPPPPTTHLPSMATQPFSKPAAPGPGFMEAHQGLCLSTDHQPPSAQGHASAPNSICSDPDCEGHRCEGSGVYEQPYEGEESGDEDSCSEHSSSTSTSTNQKEGKYCDCCYCEFFGHGGPPAAPTSRNYAEMREKLRLRLTKRKEEQPKKEEPGVERDGLEDHRKVEDLLQFINSADSKRTSSSKAAKRARHKQKKLEEKARVEAVAREQLLEAQREEEEVSLKQELLRLKEMRQLRAAKKKKKESKSKEAVAKTESSAHGPAHSPQPLRQTAQNVLENMQNGKTHLLHSLVQLGPKEPRLEVGTPPPARRGPSPQHSPKSIKEKPTETPVPPPASLHHMEPSNSKARPRQQPTSRTSTEAHKRPADVSRPPEAPKAAGVPACHTDSRAKPRTPEEPPEPKKEERTGGKKHQKEESCSPMSDATIPELPQQNGKATPSDSPQTKATPSDSPQTKATPSDSPQTKGRAKKNKKKKADKMNNSIDDVFLPKDIDLDSVDIDETEREVEYFKRFCLDSARQTRQRLSINWSNFSLKKATFVAH
ncbi:protein FAM193A isoform X2 [Brachyhypopomus gauderio]|uniref:protein FAM193A isoform X2 n=1 Tax=Brachyhypopomus gauderio TaxID=698409 RepID=UPI004041B5DE